MTDEVLKERARCARIARATAHLAKVGAMKFSGFTPDPLIAAQLTADSIALSIEAGDDPGKCDCGGVMTFSSLPQG